MKLYPLLLVAIAAIAMPTVVDAGPPLLCPGTVLTEAELEQLAPIRDKKTSTDDAVKKLCQQLAASDSGRFHFEAIRYFFHGRRQGMEALEQALRPEKMGKTLRDYDYALTRVIRHYGRSGVLQDVDRMAQVADARRDPALRLSVAEALDLVGDVGTGSRHLLSRLSLSYFEGALEGVATGKKSEMLRKLVTAHLPFMRGMHSRDWDWGQLNETLRKAGFTEQS
ncbi:MAG: hypothetical protein AAF581_14070 [Planctomycetota bacterium]